MRKLPVIFILSLFCISCASYPKDHADHSGNSSGKNREVLLTQHVWKMEEITQVENNSRIYYKRGENANTNDYGNDELSFLPDGTGTYSTKVGRTYPITWQFNNREKTKLTIAIAFASSSITTLKCSDLDLTETRFFCVTNFINDAHQPVLASVYRTPL